MRIDRRATGSHAGDLLRPIATPCARAQSTGEAYDLSAIYGASDEVSGTWAEQAGATNDRTSLDGDDAPLEVRGAWARETVEADKRAGAVEATVCTGFSADANGPEGGRVRDGVMSGGVHVATGRPQARGP